jgi:hypothetical protein
MERGSFKIAPSARTSSLIMNTRHLLRTVILVSALAFPLAFTATLRASPDDEIMRAVSAGGARNVQQAEPRIYLNAFSSVLARKKEKGVPAYVSAAVKLRPDLADRVVVAALHSHRYSDKEMAGKEVACDWVEPIIRAAIAAAPRAKDAIVRAAIESDPWARDCILAAAGITRETETAFLYPPGIGTINPSNIGGNLGNVQSLEQP